MTETISIAHEYGVAPSGYRLPDATTLGRVRLQIADLDHSLDFYEGVLGLRVLSRSSDGAVLGANGDDAPLVELTARAGARPVSRRGQLGLYHFAILLPDRPALGRFLAHLATLGIRAGMSDHLVSEAIYLTDPDGLGIEVYADRPRSEWSSRNRELVMATEPLDAPSLLRSAAGEPWTGAPRGTRIGHVHLHVGDLETAAAFYHGGVGFDRVVWSYPGALFLSAGGYHHHLGTNTWAAGAQPAREGDAQLLEWVIELPTADDLDAAAASIQLAGYAVRHAGSDVLATDPWGTTVRLQAR